ncbi:hypothetical protein [Tropicimonas sp. IMCC6043]|uniref:hypothetical protein n=1 Tax=Tropicimonas sp. IMCC6043 TaxID=2510645 RepID=UPI00101B9E87|nr:hypothetical protein [Tropicimonas sp. IMCC6043]RYH11657.1 hypothetical protein EU800_03195 [Tropicimonas sp. IMCC6043]
MSNPVSNAEIEDVLSSIRRLVAGDRAQGPSVSERSEEDPETSHPEPESKEGTALVLTPSLRIEEEAAIWDADPEAARPGMEEADETEREETVLPTPAEAAEEDPLPDVDGVAPFARNVEEAPEEEEDALPTFVRVRHWSDTPETPQVETPPSQDAADDAASRTEATPPSDESEVRDGQELLSGRMVPRAGFHFSALEDEDSDFQPPVQEDEAAEEAFGPFDGADMEIPEDWTGADDAPDEPEASLSAAAAEIFADAQLGRSTESVASEVADTAPQKDIDDPWQDVSGGGEDWLDAVEPESSDDDAEATNLFSVPAPEIDEEALRDLVAEMLHRELRGPLGERITRNVRKLVRREIHRALATRDFD